MYIFIYVYTLVNLQVLLRVYARCCFDLCFVDSMTCSPDQLIISVALACSMKVVASDETLPGKGGTR